MNFSSYWWIALGFFSYVSCLRIQRKFQSKDFFVFISRFGFQRTYPKSVEDTLGYIFGNITIDGHESLANQYSLVVVDSDYFLDFFINRTVLPQSAACNLMFSRLSAKAWDGNCNPYGTEDFIRFIPCPKQKICEDETPDYVLPGYQFTYRISNTEQPRFWYVSLASCSHRLQNGSSNCGWHAVDDDVTVDVDMWLVNGSPNEKHLNPFEHQFSFETFDVVEIYLACLFAYIFLVPVQVFALRKCNHPLLLLLMTCMCMECLGVLLNLVHFLKFAFDGVGVELFRVVGNFVDNCAQCLFMLLLLLTIKDWSIRRLTLPKLERVILFSVWTVYTVANLVLFIWNLVEVDIISDTDEWQTRPGFIILIFRLAIMFWFLFELRNRLRADVTQRAIQFHLHFGAGFLVWFVYLPITAFILTQTSALYRFKTMLSVVCAADFLSYCVLLYVLWPTRLELLSLPDESMQAELLTNGWISGSHKSDNARAMHEYAALSNVDVSESEEELFETTSFMEHNSARVEDPAPNITEARTHNHSHLHEEDEAEAAVADVEDFVAVEAGDTEDLFTFR